MEEVYFKIQKQYRDAQARLNELKHECVKAVEQSLTKVKAQYSKAVEEWNARCALLEARKAEYIQNHVTEISAYRIVIPDSLQKIYREVNGLGKNS